MRLIAIDRAIAIPGGGGEFLQAMIGLADIFMAINLDNIAQPLINNQSSTELICTMNV